MTPPGESDRDILIEIRTDLKNLSKQFDAHLLDDTTRFSRMEADVAILQRGFWLATGAIIIFQFLISVSK